MGKAHLALGKAYQSAGPELNDKAEAALQRAWNICAALCTTGAAAKAQVLPRCALRYACQSPALQNGLHALKLPILQM